MKKVMMLLGVLFLLAAPGMAQNVQKEVENMYERRAQKAEAERLAAEQIQAQIRKQEEAWQRHLQQNWEYLAKDGAKHFDRKRVEEAVRPFMSLNEVLDSIPLEITDPKAVLSRGSVGADSSLAGAPQTRFSQTKIPQPQIRFLPDSIYNIAYPEDYVFSSYPLNFFYNPSINPDDKTQREKLQQIANKAIWKDFEKRKIHKGPLLLVKKPDGACVVVDSEYKAYDKAKCDDYPSYTPTVESRKKALRDLGFSENTVQKYAVKNPWNLETFVACDKFKVSLTFKNTYELVEKVVMAWRYSSFTDDKTKQNERQYRFVFIRKDGKEYEDFSFTLDDKMPPQCLDFDGKSRESVYKSITQAEPPKQQKVTRAILSREHSFRNPDRANGTYFLESKTFDPAHCYMLSLDEEWGF